MLHLGTALYTVVEVRLEHTTLQQTVGHLSQVDPHYSVGVPVGKKRANNEAVHHCRHKHLTVRGEMVKE